MPNVKGQGKDTLGRKKSTGRPKGGAPRKNESTAAATAAKQILDGEKTYREVEKEAGISNTVLRSAVAREEGRRDPEIDRNELSLTAQQKLDAALRQHQRKLDASFASAVDKGVRERIDEIVLPHWKEKIDQAQQLYARRRGLMDKA